MSLADVGQLDLTEYTLDRAEMGKVLIVASATLLVVSAHAVLQFSATESRLSDAYADSQRASSVVESQSFNRSLRTLASFQAGTQISRQVRTLVDTASAMETASQDIQEARQNLGDKREMYQWLVVISVAGLATGLAERYI
nr:MAG: hypothetical protein J07AB56_14070 [Candidatus Nanosalinarum sp. J07AB56]